MDNCDVDYVDVDWAAAWSAATGLSARLLKMGRNLWYCDEIFTKKFTA